MTQEIKQRIEQIKRGEVPQGYKKTKVGIVPSEWEILSINDILNKVGENVDVKQDVLYQQIGIRSHGKGIFYKEPVTGEMLGNKSVFWVQPNCLIVNIVFAWEQAISRTTDSEKGMIGSHRFPMYVPKDRKSDVDYLVYFFMTRRGKSLLEDASPGGAGRNKTLGQKEFAQSKLAVPLIVEQQKIAEILTTQDKVIELKEKLLAEKQAQKKWLMQNLLTGKKRLKGFSGEWKKVKLEECGTIVTGTTPPTNINDYYNGEYPWITPTDISESKNIYTSERTLTEKGIAKGRFIPKNSLLVTCIASIGKNTILRKNGSCNQQINAITPNENYNVDFLYYYISYKTYILKLNAGTSATQILNKETFSKLKFNIPPLPEQTAIAEIFSTADREIDFMKKEIEAEKQRKKALMQILLTGLVRVNV